MDTKNNGNRNNSNAVDPDKIPLFLVLEVTKKTMKLVYVDTLDMLSEKVFREHGLKVKILNVADCEDKRYQFVGCRISGRDIDQFRTCIEDLERKLLLTGYRDYRESSLTHLVNLIEKSEPTSPDNDLEKEYPKSVFIPFIPQESMEDILLAIYALSRTETNHPEVCIMNSKPVEDREGYILPNDAYALVLREGTPISYNIFRKTYLQHRNGITAVTALDLEDKHRVSILLLPETEYTKSGIPMNPIVTFYDRETEARLAGFFRQWDMQYQETKEAEMLADKKNTEE